MSNSIKGIFFSLFGGVFIISSGKSDVNRFTTFGAKIVNLWHGAPMKKIGLDENVVNRGCDNRIINSKFFWKYIPKYLFPFLYNYAVDRVISTSPIFTQKLSSAFDIPVDKIIVTGYPRNDIFFSQNKINKYVFLDKTQYKYVFLYLPTFRSGKSLDQIFTESKFNLEKINELMKVINGVFVFKGHFASPLKNEASSARVISIPPDELFDLNTFMRHADVLLTDYSGCYFDFMLLNKPIILTPFDLKEYTEKDRELYFNYKEISAGPIAVDWDDVYKHIMDYSRGVDSFIKKREDMNDNFNYYHDGLSSKRVYKIICDLIGVSAPLIK
jgi:CDP-glycerol glycerophosphotransferase (TagB/SpsB family)